MPQTADNLVQSRTNLAGSHAGQAALGSVVAGLLGLVVVSAGAAAVGGLLLLAAVGLGVYARHWLSGQRVLCAGEDVALVGGSAGYPLPS